MCAALASEPLALEAELEFSLFGGLAYALVTHVSNYKRRRYMLSGDWLELRGLNVDQHARGKGYGAAMLTKVIAYCDQHGYSLCLVVRPYDRCPMAAKDLMAFYHRYGFRQTSLKSKTMVRHVVKPAKG